MSEPGITNAPPTDDPGRGVDRRRFLNGTWKALGVVLIAEGLWTNINLKNLRENILPTRARADLILRKGADHLIEEVALRKL